MTAAVAERLARMQAGREAAQTRRRQHAHERVATFRAWQRSLAAVILVEREFGSDSDEYVTMKLNHSERWAGVYVEQPSSYDYDLVSEAS